MRVRRPKKFIEDYNKEVDKMLGVGVNPALPPNFLNNQVDQESENRIYMGGIPNSMNSEEVRKLCTGFGTLKSFNLVMDQTNKMLNRGFAFLEYSTEKETDKAIKALDGFEIMDKKLKVQKASVGAKAPSIRQQPAGTIGFQNYVEPSERIKIPLFALTPSRVVQFLNMIDPEDIIDPDEKRQVLKDLCDECKEYGDVLLYRPRHRIM